MLRSVSRHRSKLLILFGLIVVAAAILYFSKSSQPPANYQTVEIARTDLTVTISATGTVEPEEVIDVGAQVAGLILSFGTDTSGAPIDYGSEVRENMVLAQIDQSLYQTDVQQARSQLVRAEAELEQAKAQLNLASKNWERAQKLGPSDALSKSAFDTYRLEHESALATVGVRRAAIVQAEAALARADRNLSLTTIRSPVDGVIIDRKVNIGQTVVSSLNAPSLFLIAKDLRKMQVWVSVNEADVGLISPGQRVTFTVDAFPDQTFEGEVRKLRLNATMSQNVVTYIVEVVADNSDERLLPYLTADVRFLVADRANALVVSNAALRWNPPPGRIHPDASAPQAVGPGTAIVWTPVGELVRPINVSIGASDGILTELLNADELEGIAVVTGDEIPAIERAPSRTNNPFAPSMSRRRRR